MRYRNKQTGEVVEAITKPQFKLTPTGYREMYTIYKVNFIMAADLFEKTYEPLEEGGQDD